MARAADSTKIAGQIAGQTTFEGGEVLISLGKMGLVPQSDLTSIKILCYSKVCGMPLSIDEKDEIRSQLTVSQSSQER